MSSAELSHASTETDERTREDCLACKLVGSAAFVGVGLYALRVAHQDGTFSRVRPPGGSLIGGRVAALMGVGEYLHLRPEAYMLTRNHRLPWPWGRAISDIEEAVVGRHLTQL